MRKSLRSDPADAFIPDPAGGRALARDTLAESLAEEYLRSATSAEEVSEDVRDEVLPEELGGPFLEVPAAGEFDSAPDDSNPEDAEQEAFPRVLAARR